MKIDKAYSQYKKVGARVISKGSGNWYNTFVINKGSKDGIKVNMNVIADGGLVGIVTETGRTYAKVCSIINDSSSVSAKSSQAGDTCVVQGNSESVQKDGTIDVTYISKDADMKEGEELITSHISSKYLEGIKIGTVSKISTDSSNLTKSAKVTPFCGFSAYRGCVGHHTVKRSSRRQRQCRLKDKSGGNKSIVQIFLFPPFV